eukprot:scaffold4372_cov397-Prasinococcus_capsulatus_cf.AAC.26
MAVSMPYRGGGPNRDISGGTAPLSSLVSKYPGRPPDASVVARVKNRWSIRVIRTFCSTQSLWKPSPQLNRYRRLSKKSRTDAGARPPYTS